MVKYEGQVPGLPPGVPADGTHATANAVHSAALRLLRRARTADTEMDLDGPRASALSVLVFAGPVPIGRLAAIEQVTPPAITKTVAALERDGLAERIHSEGDRRVVMVQATPRGRDRLERGRAARVRVVADLLARLSEGDLQTLDRAAAIIAGLLAESGGASPRRGT
jgi:DNA-binding MarR family transcriptional regulator